MVNREGVEGYATGSSVVCSPNLTPAELWQCSSKGRKRTTVILTSEGVC